MEIAEKSLTWAWKAATPRADILYFFSMPPLAQNMRTKKRITVITDPKYHLHDTGGGEHPEIPERLAVHKIAIASIPAEPHATRAEAAPHAGLSAVATVHSHGNG